MITLRRRQPQEMDAELLWLGIFLLTAATGAAWLHFGLPTPACPVHALTGLPCPTCGATRCLRELLAGHPAQACAWNPMVFAGALLAAGFVVYAACVTAFRLPRLRLETPSKAQLQFLRLGLAAVLGANWLYLVWRLPRG